MCGMSVKSTITYRMANRKKGENFRFEHTDVRAFKTTFFFFQKKIIEKLVLFVHFAPCQFDVFAK
jgi:hypothetical protein